MNDKALSLLGMARRAGRLSVGHDAAVEAIVKNCAQLCVCAADASDRLKNELRHACTYQNKNIPFAETSYPMAALSKAIGCKAAVVTVNDSGFAERLTALLEAQQLTGKDGNYAER